MKQLVLAEPGIGFFSGSWTEPEACEPEGLALNGEGGVTGIDVAVEAQVSAGNFICAGIGLPMRSEGDEKRSGRESYDKIWNRNKFHGDGG